MPLADSSRSKRIYNSIQHSWRLLPQAYAAAAQNQTWYSRMWHQAWM